MISAHLPADRFFEYADLLKKHDIGIEYYPSASFIDANLSYSYQREKKYDFLITSIHAPFYEFAPQSRDSKIREVANLRFNQTIEIAKKLNVKKIVFHTGYFYYTCRGEKWKQNLLNFWLEKVKTLKRENIEVYFENVFEFDYTPLKLLLDNLPSNFGWCLDTGHFNLFSKLPLEEWFENIGKYLMEIHIHNNFGFDDNHLPPSKGTFNFGSLIYLLKNLNKKVYFVIENRSFKEVLESKSYILNNLGEFVL